MLFKDLTEQKLMEKIREKDILCIPMWGTVFCTVMPNQEKSMNLKSKFKPSNERAGLATDYQQQLAAEPTVVQKARDKMEKAQFVGDHYDNAEGSLKLHLSLNNIGEIDEAVILGLIQLLTKESEDLTNNLSFHFKIIRPHMHNHDRFKMTDQLTLYFDKYSSVGEMRLLAQKIDEYLQKHIKVNTQALGPKDNFGLNSFVSARFDTNKLLKRYDVHPFFDVQLKKFINSHTDEELRNLPICALEAVFNTIITSKDISITHKKELSEADSIKVQTEFESMLKDPAGYMNAHLKQAKQEVAQDDADKKVVLARIEGYFKKARDIMTDFDLSQDFNTLNTKIAESKALFDQIKKDPHLEKDFKMVDAQVFTQFGELMHDKEKAFNDMLEKVVNQSKEIAALDLVRNKQHLLTLTQTHRHPKPILTTDSAKHFESLLNKLNKKSIQLSGSEKGRSLRILYNILDLTYNEYKEGNCSYLEFIGECDTAIKNALPVLEKHRWLKEILVNLWEAIKSLGSSMYQEYKKSKGEHYFFKVPTESSELAQNLDIAAKELGEKPAKSG